jgi:hypothetical protein
VTATLLPALAAAFLPSRAAALLARQPDPEQTRRAERLAPLPREARLAALAEALAARPGPSRQALEAAAARERPGLAAALRAGEATAATLPVLRRLVTEQAWR